jgi:hypothetical protein
MIPPPILGIDFNIHQNLHLNSDQFKILPLVPTNPVAMSPSAEINQQPQAQEMTADQTAQQVVTSQPVRLHFIRYSAIFSCSILLADADYTLN